ncbi:metal ABC transporter permease [Actinomyces sp. zg-332]|uniref:metal ABC transporter permease n=1 Tax=Actinomyces sp. zg-332 TaxID=2708340 RepID=UPI0014211AAD|nr:metal ABC transporter permease [Actinomyces sp. zg-332]QPK94473.1 metal ABC transporter permease [Actinomyces sp. zg-332]
MLNSFTSLPEEIIESLRTFASYIFFLEPLTEASYIFRPFLILILLGIISGTLGVLVNLRHLEFISEGIVHAIFPGIIGGFAILNGVIGIIPGAVFIGIISAFIFTISTKHKTSSEALIALTLTTFFGIGIVIVSYVKDMSGQLESLLFGRLLTVTEDLVTQTIFVCFISLLLCCTTWKEQVFRAFDLDGYQGYGYKVFWTDLILNLSITFAVIAASTAVGTLLAIGYVIIPPATAKLICNRISTMIPISIFVATFSGYLGLLTVTYTSEVVELSPQAMVICYMTILYALAYPMRFLLLKMNVKKDSANAHKELVK